MARRVMFSFHFANDAWRAATVRSIGALDGNNPVSDNEWEAIKKGGDAAIESWIDGQLEGKSCIIVLVGAQTADRPWVIKEIIKAWNAGKGVLGIRIHGLKDQKENTTTAGPNPFDRVYLKSGTVTMSSVVSLHLPSGSDSKSVYDSIATNVDAWVEKAVNIRANYV